MKKILKKITGEYRLMIFGYVPVMFFLFTAAFLVLRFPDVAAQGVQNGIDMSLNILVPSMYVFIVISTFFVQSGICDKLEPLFSKITYYLMRLPGFASMVFIVSVLGGYPVGAKCIEELYKKGSITKEQGQRMLLFCVNPSPSFVIGTVGYFMLGKRELGVIIYLSVIIASLIVGILTRFIASDEVYGTYRKSTKENLGMSEAFTSSVKQSAVSMFVICAFVTLFSCINELLGLFNFSDGMLLFFKSILEVTNGCMSASGVLSASVIAAIIAFGGVCTHCQLMSTIIKLKLNLKLFFASRVVSASLSAVICHGILAIVPVSYETFATGERPEIISPAYSVPVSVGMILLTILLILGDNFIFVSKKKDKEKVSSIK